MTGTYLSTSSGFKIQIPVSINPSQQSTRPTKEKKTLLSTKQVQDLNPDEAQDLQKRKKNISNEANNDKTKKIMT
ncbi:11191_t:CDS:2, partial [Ambispora leptoticha]